MVSMSKTGGTDVRERVNHGSGPVRMIAGRPVAKMRSAQINMGGAGVRWIRISDDWNVYGALVVTVKMLDGTARVKRMGGTFEGVRGEVIRAAVKNGVFAGIARMS